MPLLDLLDDTSVSVVLVVMGKSAEAQRAAQLAGRVTPGPGGAWGSWHEREMARIHEDWQAYWGWRDDPPPLGVFLLEQGEDYERYVADVELARGALASLTDTAATTLLRERFRQAYDEWRQS